MKRAVNHLIFLLVLLITFVVVGLVSAASASGTWQKNGATMRGSHNADFVGGLDRKMDTNSNVTIPPGVIQYIAVYGYLDDRCKNQDGTWQPWNNFKMDWNTAAWSSTVSVSFQGTYQHCHFGHEYRNRSLHIFQYPAWSLNENHWLCSAPAVYS